MEHHRLSTEPDSTIQLIGDSDIHTMENVELECVEVRKWRIAKGTKVHDMHGSGLRIETVLTSSVGVTSLRLESVDGISRHEPKFV